MTQRRDAGPWAGTTWDSALSAAEFAAVTGAGFDPVGLVGGTAVTVPGSTDPAGCPGAWTVTEDGRKVSSSAWGASSLPQALYAARALALRRAVAECRELGGDGIVGVDLRTSEFPAGGTEFTVRGTAVRARSRIQPRTPFTSHLTGQDFARLVHSGWIPAGLVLGIAVETRHDDWRISPRSGWTAGFEEISGYTRLIDHARRQARGQLAVEAAKLGGDGVVVGGTELAVNTSRCPESLSENAHDLSALAVLTGTCIARFGRSRQPAGAGLLTIMRLEREH